MEAYTELVELAQRKFLRQIVNLTDTGSTRPFPRLFSIDLRPPELDPDSLNDLNSTMSRRAMPISMNRSLQRTNFLQRDQYTRDTNALCLRALCEHENSWHPTGTPLEYELITNIPQTHFAYFIRMMSLVKQSGINLDITSHGSNKIDEVLDFIEDCLPNEDDEVKSDLLKFENSFNSVKDYIVGKLEMIENKKSSFRHAKNTVNGSEFCLVLN